MAFVDLFSGAGLFSYGFALAGFVPALALDLDPDAVSSYNTNIARVARTGDVTRREKVPDVSLLIAGPPCQGFSTLGRRDVADERNSLCLEIPRWARTLNVDVVVTENVPPFTSSPQWGRMTERLKRDGYEIDVWLLDAASFGTAQHRRRAFTIASRIGLPSAPPEHEASLAASIAFVPTREGDPLHTWPAPTQLALQRMSMIPPKGDKRDILLAAPELCPPSWLRLGTQEATDTWGRIDPSKPSNTIRCRFQNPSVGRYTHPTDNRVISLREGARLQGIPDHWTFNGTREAIARQIGNGVPVPLAHAVAVQIMTLFKQKQSLQAA
jgi:DNA (cytosine-5)-methyltransferase 1